MQIHSLYRDPKTRGELLAVLGSAFTRVPARIDAARALGWDWDAMTTPFVDRVDGRIVSHVGVLEVPLRLDGRAVRVAGIHAVCTLPSHRRRGCYRRVMERAMAFVEARWELAQLYTSQPELYEPFGFRVVPTSLWEAPRPDTARSALVRPLALDADLPALAAALSRRAPVSDRYASVDDGWLLGLDAVLATGDLSRLFRVPGLDAFVAGRLDDDRLTLYDVVAPELPSFAELCAHLPGEGPIGLAFTPDRFPDARARAAGPASFGAYMVRGPFPLEPGSFAIPPLCHH